jgi:hypothetical protein
MLTTPCIYVTPNGALNQHFPVINLSQFASKGVQLTLAKKGVSKTKTVTITMDNQITALYTVENFRARRYAQIEYFNIATATRLIT